MKTKPFLSFWQIWNLTFGFLGIQFGFALQNANSSRILQIYGADVEQLSLCIMVVDLCLVTRLWISSSRLLAIIRIKLGVN